MKLLLTSAGLSNSTLRDALADLTGRPLTECRAIIVPTAILASDGGPEGAAATVAEVIRWGFGSVGTVELTALPSLPPGYWRPAFEAADVIVVGGGNGGYLSHWAHRTPFAGAVSRAVARGAVYVGVSAGSILATPGFHVHRPTLLATGRYWDDEYDEWAPDGAADDRGLGLVQLTIRPHYQTDDFPSISPDLMRTVARHADAPLYAIDDDTALSITDGVVTPVGDGLWERFEAGGE